MFRRNLIAIASLATLLGSTSLAYADAPALNFNDPTTKAAMDAYMKGYIHEHAAVIYTEVQKYLQDQQAANAPQLGDFVAKADSLIATPGPREGVDTAKAKVVLIEFFDYNCPFCQQLHKEIRKLQDDPANADVAYVYRDLPILGSQLPSSFDAAYAARAAWDQGKFHDFADGIFTLPAHGVDENGIMEMAKRAELDIDKFNAFRKRDDVKKAITDDLETGRQLKIAGTPFIFLWSPEHRIGQVIGGLAPAETIAGVIDKLRNGQQPPAL